MVFIPQQIQRNNLNKDVLLTANEDKEECNPVKKKDSKINL